MNQDEHIAWAKERALKYLDRGDRNGAVTSMLSDLSKHDETRGIGMKMSPYGMWLLMNQRSANDVRHFIEGFR